MPADGSAVVTVVVTTRNSAETLEACLRSIRAQKHPNIELVVVDNSSTDATVDIAQRYADVVRTGGPERSAQRNQGASIGSGATLLFIDSDMVLDDGVVAQGLAALDSSGLPAVIVPEQTVGEGYWTRCRSLERSCYTGDDTVEAARLYTRAAFEAAGGFDVTLNGGEDWDLSRRVAGGRRLPRTSAVITHDEGTTRLRTVYRKRRYYAPGYLRYLAKHGREVHRQGNPLLRAAYVRNWRRLARHPALTAGILTLKVVEAAAVLEVAAEQRWSPRRGAQADPYALVERREALGRPMLVTFGSILQPDGGLAVRSRIVAETLAALGCPAAVVTTREPQPRSAPPWARSLTVLRRKPRLAFSLELARRIRAVARHSDVVIIANAMFMPALTLSGTRLPVIWDTNECQTLHYQRLRPTPRNRVRLVVWTWLERWAASRCAVAVAIGAAEAGEWERIHPSLRGKVLTVDHAAFIAPAPPRAATEVPDSLLGERPPGPVLVFVGTMRAKHNAAAARWIIDVLAPSLPPTVTILLCGPGTDGLPAGDAGARVRCLGAVPDVDAVIAAADLCLAPLASGAGVKTKVLHYLAHGRRVAGTAVAFEGLEGAPGLFETSLETLPVLVAQLCDEEEAADVVAARQASQRSWIECHHGRDRIAHQWRAVLACLDQR